MKSRLFDRIVSEAILNGSITAARIIEIRNDLASGLASEVTPAPVARKAPEPAKQKTEAPAFNIDLDELDKIARQTKGKTPDKLPADASPEDMERRRLLIRACARVRSEQRKTGGKKEKAGNGAKTNGKNGKA